MMDFKIILLFICQTQEKYRVSSLESKKEGCGKAASLSIFLLCKVNDYDSAPTDVAVLAVFLSLPKSSASSDNLPGPAKNNNNATAR